LFSTLSTTTSKIKYFKKSKPVLLTDTVGFIKDLPHWLIDAFHSTLEEIELADVIVLLIDGSDSIDEIKEKTLTSLQELHRMERHPDIIVALNKIDLISNEEIKKRKKIIEEITGKKCIPISVKRKEGIDELVQEIYNKLPDEIEMKISFPKNLDFVEWLYENAEIEEMLDGDKIEMKIKCSMRVADIVKGKCEKLGGRVILNGNERKN